jgi:putative ABC transport system substrate-binding protein
MRRRDFVTLLGGAVFAWPNGALAQRPATPVIGFLHYGRPELFTDVVTAFRYGLREAGYVEGENVAIEFRWANNQPEALDELARDLVRLNVAVIFASGSPLPTHAAKAATSMIPIVFAFGDDPVQHGLVAGWGRPGGNITGVTTFSGELTPKRFELLCELVPQATTVAFMLDPRAVTAKWQTNRVLEAARALQRQVIVLEVRSEHDIEAAFAILIQRLVSALLVGPYPLFIANREKILALAAHHKVPAMYSDRLYTLNGGLVSYGASFADNYRQGAHYIGQILNGAKPADLPVQQHTKFNLVINLKTAKALGLEIPPTLLAIADEVIE